MAGPTSNASRYLPERPVDAPVAGRFEVAIDQLRGGRVTLYHPPAERVDSQQFLTVARREIERLAPLRDTGYCTALDAGLDTQGEPFVVLDRPQGRSLAGVLHDQGQMRADLALAMIIDLSDPVERAHHLNVLPVPLTLDGIFLQPRADGHYRVSLVDRALHRTALAALVPAPLRPKAFESPQVFAGAAPEIRDDVFSMTALLYLCLYGVMPPPMGPHGPTDGSGWPTVPSETLRLDRRLEACLHTVLLKGLAPTREGRFRNLGGLRRGLVGLRQLMRLSAAAFEVLAATRGRLGRLGATAGPLDLQLPDPELDRAAAAVARIQQVYTTPGGGSLSRLRDER
ncbi:MAG: hypothetical protein KC613_15665 [Myxococcales bacterium]|nr:hypothetical protein [Myxococcales bacterium]